MRRVVGCMTGTSIDGIDAALVEIDGAGLAMKPRLIRGVSRDLGPVREPLRRLADQHPMTAAEIAAAMHEFSQLHVRAIRALIQREKCDLICVHGQTVFHKPPLSWQLMQPAPIAREFRVPVVFDLRAMDLASGGQGAPITPIADFIAAGATGSAIVNLGGYCNMTLLPKRDDQPFARSAMDLAQVKALDVCPCNNLLDAISRELFNQRFDDGGKHAITGTSHSDALDDLNQLFAALSDSRRSLGTGDETVRWISRWRTLVDPCDLAATACEAIAQSVANASENRLGHDVLVAGGGTKNFALMQALDCKLGGEPEPIPGGWATYREAACFAILGALCQDRTPITLPQVTGCPSPAPISGAWVLP
jgi:1,6-anhydro-N-acetylmuramate kinase